MAEISVRSEIDKIGSAKFWLDAIDEREKQLKEWHDKAWKVIERYRDEKTRNNSSRFNILYGNTRVMKPALYARSPNPDVRRRFRDKDPVAGQVGELIERALSTSLEAVGEYDFDYDMQKAVEDYILPGLAVAVVDYEPVYGDQITPKIPYMGAIEGELPEGVMAEDGGMPYTLGDPFEPVEDEKATCRYWFWEDFIWGAARKWDNVPWVAFRSYMTREQLEEINPKLAPRVELDWSPPNAKKKRQDEIDEFKRATVWKLWDKKEKKIRYLAKGLPTEELAVEADPLRLKGFFPCPRPLMAVTTNDTMMPIPMYYMYKDQAEELDDVNDRIRKLTKKLQAKGIYNSVHKQALSQLYESEDNALIPVAVHGADNIDMSKMVAYWPIEMIAKVLASMYVQRDQIKAVIFEIVGLSDIIRGTTDPGETLGAQKIKSDFASLSLQDMQKEVQRFARDIIRMKAEIMAEHFSPETLGRMANMPVTPEMAALLKNEKLLGYKIDIETDSTIQPNADAEQKNFIEMISAITQMLTSWAPIVQSGVVPIEVAKSVMMAGVRRFKNVRDVEDALESIGEQPPPPQPDPEAKKAEAEMSKIQQQGQVKQVELQLKQQESAAELQMKEREMAQEAQLKQMQMMFEQKLAEAELRMKREIEVMKINANMAGKAMMAEAAARNNEQKSTAN